MEVFLNKISFVSNIIYESKLSCDRNCLLFTLFLLTPDSWPLQLQILKKAIFIFLARAFEQLDKWATFKSELVY